MIKITLKDGIVKEFESGISVLDVAKNISEGLARNTFAGLLNGEVVDIRQIITEDSALQLLTFDDKGGKEAFRHTAAHILAQAATRLFPEIKVAIGPATEDGFYYDFDKEKPFTQEEILAIEAEMKKIVKEDIKIECFEMGRNEALEYFKNLGEIYKVELISDLPEDEIITFYKQGDFVDLCRGPHLLSTKYVKAVKLIADGGSSGAYWRGDEKNKMLSRIYGSAFTKAADLEEYLEYREEAKKRDHNKLGRELKYFTTNEHIGQGLPLFMPKGAKIYQLLQRFVENEEEKRGYVFTRTPYMAKSDLYKLSGHWDLYKDGMFVLGDEEKDREVFALRPMTCPFHFSIYNSEQHSYRDLPIRYAETAPLFRNESSGEMHGLTRVRQFSISEGHLVCTKEQLKDEFKACIELNYYMMKTLGLHEEITYCLSKWDPANKAKYIGEESVWEETQDFIRQVLIEMNLPFYEEEGGAAFYGPKLDFQAKNVYGKEDTLFTVQVDFALAERFSMTYIDADGSKQHPVVIHRTSIGCYERTMALLIEKYAGAMPTWLSPIQVYVLPISDKHNDYAQSVINSLKEAGIRAVGDFRAEKIGYKIREARNERTPYIFVIGEKEAEEQTVAVRSRANGEEGSKSVLEMRERIAKEIEEKCLSAALPTATKLRRNF